MKPSLKLTGLAVLLGVAAAPAAAQEKIKIGVITTLSGPAAVLGQQSRDGLQLGDQGPRRQDGAARTSRSSSSMTNSSPMAP